MLPAVDDDATMAFLSPSSTVKLNSRKVRPSVCSARSDSLAVVEGISPEPCQLIFGLVAYCLDTSGTPAIDGYS